TLNRPSAKNAFNERMYNELADALLEAREEREARVIVLTGAGQAFSAGQDLGEMNAVHEGPVGFERLIDSLEDFDKPIVAAVNGVGVGLGFTILLHTDINVFAASARLRLPFLPLGVVPEAASSFLLPQRIGYQRAAELVLTARWVPADEALSLGIALEVVPDDELITRAMTHASRIAAQPPAAARHSKRLLRAAERDQVKAARAREVDAFRVRLGSPENLEAVRAFFEKRPPDFSNLPPE
ncbi:MAG: enoyl-CoA hydratase/isomerase family protein, partial [Polyangiaceae bacterium]|nr:enoyl-CoA hydratase/isomerase family protein [Polyangiaceae bacterium]